MSSTLAPLYRSCTTSHQSAIVTIAISCTYLCPYLFPGPTAQKFKEARACPCVQRFRLHWCRFEFEINDCVHNSFSFSLQAQNLLFSQVFPIIVCWYLTPGLPSPTFDCISDLLHSSIFCFIFLSLFIQFSSVQFVTLLKQNVLRGCRLA